MGLPGLPERGKGRAREEATEGRGGFTVHIYGASEVTVRGVMEAWTMVAAVDILRRV